MAAKKNDVLLVARQTTTVDAGGETYPLLAGVTRLRSSHPVAKARPNLFEPVDPQPPDVEQATVAPGEQRADQQPAPDTPTPKRTRRRKS
jgi:hypothetical protein